MKYNTLTKLILIAFFTSFIFTSCKDTKAVAVHIPASDFKEQITNKYAQLVDVRTPAEYNQGHIENADLINFNDENFLKNALEKLDKSKPVYVYCLSGGKRSQTSVELLKEEGYEVYDLKGGIASWTENNFKTIKPESNSETLEVIKTEDKSVPVVKKEGDKIIKKGTDKTSLIPPPPPHSTKAIEEVKKVENVVKKNTEVEVVKKEVTQALKTKLTPEIIKVNTADFKSKIDGKNVQLIDVRTPNEYKDGHISKSKNININDSNFLTQTGSLDKSKPVYVYCRSGVRSMKAANKLKTAGFQVYNLNGGIKGWKSSGNNIEK